MVRADALPASERVWQPDDEAKLRIRELAADFSIEITPATAARHAALADLLPPGDPGLRRVRAGRGPPQRGRDGGARPRRRPGPGAPFSGALDRRSRPARRLSAPRHRRGRGRRGAGDRWRHRSAARRLLRDPCAARDRVCSRRTASAPSASPGTPKASASWLRPQPR